MSSAVNSMVQTNNEFNQALSQQKGSALDKDAFMLLLVTQFKYQDPLNPAEDKEFIAQLAQFSSLEQLMNLNDSMEGLTSATMQGQMINATSYIGKTVDATGTNISKTTTDQENGKFTMSTFRYAIGETSAAGAIKIYDADGQLVNSYELPSQGAGTYPFEWDGKTFSGGVVPDGIYRVVPTFTNADGQTIQYDAVVDGKVSGVITENGATYLTLEDGRNVALANVRRVSEAKVGTTTKSTTVDVNKVTDEDKSGYVMSTFKYTLEETSNRGSFSIYDKATNALVNTIDVAGQTAGTYPFQWDGKDSSGKVVADGAYQVRGTFTNKSGKIISCDLAREGSVRVPLAGDTPDNTLPDAGGGTGGTEPPAESGTETAKAA